jgi:hypothetical protein
MSEPKGEQQITGTWRSDPDDPAAIRMYGDVSLDFSPNGRLTYTIHAEGNRQIMLLAYRIEGDVLITDQPSDPKEASTKFDITSTGKLVLHYGNRPSTYVRVAENPALPLSDIHPN